MARKIAAWRRLVELGYAADRPEAERWILSDKVRAGATPVRSAGQAVDEGADLSVRGFDLPYVSKGGLKLEGALRDFGMDAAGRVCIDAGASTGGFTDCLVRHGAALVYAVDVGYGQLAGSLRNHPGVVNLERVNLGDARLESLSPKPTLGTADLSYLSLRKAVPLYARILPGGDLLCLVKPLFEIEDNEARRSGQISDAALPSLLKALCADLSGQGHGVLGITHSPVTGNHGTREFFLHLGLQRPLEGLSESALEAAAERAAARACALSPYRK
ncbi:MAG TPA: TlyA family RNA methyltransferase [Clostridia bacterium]|nr:TlyA family RNA methyltransferase [Clostridia bacterium]